MARVLQLSEIDQKKLLMQQKRRQTFLENLVSEKHELRRPYLGSSRLKQMLCYRDIKNVLLL